MVLVVAFFLFFFFYSLSLFLFFPFFFSLATSNFFFLVEIVSDSTLNETSFARQSILSLPSRPRVTGPWVRELEFSVPTVFKAIEDGVDHTKVCLVPLKKNLSLRNVSKPKVSYTGQPANLHRANARIERRSTECFLMNLGGSASAFKVPAFCHCPS